MHFTKIIVTALAINVLAYNAAYANDIEKIYKKATKAIAESIAPKEDVHNIKSARPKVNPPVKQAAGIHWEKVRANAPIPPNAIQGGVNDDGKPLYICHAHYNNGVHPGKWYVGHCNIGWGG